MPVDPIVLQIVEGTLHSVEAEMEAAIERTARSPMIRDQHDYRAGIHDRHCRKLTGRSYSAMVQPVVRDFPLEEMREGDVYYHNDVYLSEGSVGHLPDLTTTVPVFHGGQVVAFVQAFGHHDDIGGMVPGSMPAHATSAFQEGLMVPPIRLFREGLRNDELPLPPSPLPEERVAALFALLPRSHATQLRDRLQEPCYGDGHWQFDVKRYLAYAYLPRCLRKDSDR